MNELQREALRQIKEGIDRARHEGVVCEYPRGVLVDGEWVTWPFETLIPTAAVIMKCDVTLTASDIDGLLRHLPAVGTVTLRPSEVLGSQEGEDHA